MLKSHFMHQKMMTKVLLSLIPIYLMSIYLFGWRVLLLFAAVAVAGAIAEVLVMRTVQKEKVKLTEALFVSCALYTLTLPPATPIWVAVIGIVFGIVFAKTAFGGFGQNVFNPALVARCFVYIGFPAHLTMGWLEPFGGMPGGFAAFRGGVDMVTQATPMVDMQNGVMPPLMDMLLGTTSGSLGETSAVLILLVAIYLIATKTASWKIMVSTLASAGVLTTVFYFTGITELPPHYALLSGGLLFATVFMVTDPVTAPRDETAKWVYGLLIGSISIIIREFSLFREGVMFAVLVGNALSPLLDRNIREFRKSREAKRKGIETAPKGGTV